MAATDLEFQKHEMAYGAEVMEAGLKDMPASFQSSLADWIETLKSAKHAVVEFENGSTVSVITGTPVGSAVFAKGDARIPTYEVSISVPGEGSDIRCYQTPDQVNAILADVADAPEDAAAWKMISDERDENLPELVKAVYRKGGDLNRHLILLDDHGAGFFGLDLKPRPANSDFQVPNAHVDLQTRLDRILITFWDGDQRHTITLTPQEDVDAWKKVIEDAKHNPASLVIDELYNGELNSDGKFQRNDDD